MNYITFWACIVPVLGTAVGAIIRDNANGIAKCLQCPAVVKTISIANYVG